MTEGLDDQGSIMGRRAGAMKIVHRYVAISAAAGLVTIPVLDVAALGAVHLALIKELTEYFDHEFSEHAARSIVIAIAASLIPGSIGTAVGRKVMHALPFITPGLSLATMSAFSAGVSYGVGVGFVRHYEAGGTLHTFDVKDLHRLLHWAPA